MKRGIAVTTVAALSVAVALLVPAAVSGQAGRETPDGLASKTTARADELHLQAEALFEQPARYSEAAGLMVRAAQLRGPSDARAIKELTFAGKLYAYTRDYVQARTALENAAVRALALGQVVDAAHAYLDAAFMAQELADWSSVRELARRAENLADYAHLHGAVRLEILKRIGPDRIVANAR